MDDTISQYSAPARISLHWVLALASSALLGTAVLLASNGLSGAIFGISLPVILIGWVTYLAVHEVVKVELTRAGDVVFSSRIRSRVWRAWDIASVDFRPNVQWSLGVTGLHGIARIRASDGNTFDIVVDDSSSFDQFLAEVRVMNPYVAVNPDRPPGKG